MFTDTMIVARLEYVSAGKARGGKDASDWGSTSVVAVRDFMSENLMADLFHVDVMG